MPESIVVLGAGSWGIAIANLLSSNGHRVNLWEFNRDDCAMLIANRTHKDKLPGILISKEIKITNNLDEAINDIRMVVFAVPAQKLRAVCISLERLAGKDRRYINLAKGVELNSTHEAVGNHESLYIGCRVTAISHHCRDRAMPRKWREICQPQ